MKLAIACLTLGFLWTCTDATGPADQLAANRAKWEAVGLENYVYEARWWGAWSPNRQVRIVVSGGIVDSAIDLTTGQPLPPQPAAYVMKTIDDLFDIVDSAIARRSDASRVSYDPDFGYPAAAYIDMAEMTDDEFGFAVTLARPTGSGRR